MNIKVKDRRYVSILTTFICASVLLAACAPATQTVVITATTGATATPVASPTPLRTPTPVPTPTPKAFKDVDLRQFMLDKSALGFAGEYKASEWLNCKIDEAVEKQQDYGAQIDISNVVKRYTVKYAIKDYTVTHCAEKSWSAYVKQTLYVVGSPRQAARLMDSLVANMRMTANFMGVKGEGTLEGESYSAHFVRMNTLSMTGNGEWGRLVLSYKETVTHLWISSLQALSDADYKDAAKAVLKLLQPTDTTGASL